MGKQVENLPKYLKESWEIMCRNSCSNSDSAVDVLCSNHPDFMDVIRLLSIYYRMDIDHSGEKRLRDSLFYYLEDIERLREEVA